MELFEVPPDGVVSRKVFVDRVVEIFVQRRSLQLTLADYEVGVRRHLGFRIGVGLDRYGIEKFSRRVRHSPIPLFLFLRIADTYAARCARRRTLKAGRKAMQRGLY